MSRYQTPQALRRALEDRLLALVRREGGDINRLRRQTAFDRLLCRLLREANAPWLLKGGYWKSSVTEFHPDARFQVEQELQPGARWAANATPYLWIFAGRDIAQWRTVEGLARLARSSLLISAGGK